MPVPPVEIRIKRKATDDPVELLRVQNEVEGIREIKPYYFKRQRRALDLGLGARGASPSLTPQSAISLTEALQVSGIEVSRRNYPPTLGSHDYGQPLGLSRNGKESNDGQRPSLLDGPMVAHRDQSGGIGPSEIPLVVPNNEPRRFHLSRTSIRSPPDVASSQARGDKGVNAVFMERRRPADPVSVPMLIPSPVAILQNTSGDGIGSSAIPQPSKNTFEPVMPFKGVELPSATVIPSGGNSSTVAQEMQAYALQKISPNLAEASEPESMVLSSSIIKARQVSRFKPKVPALRYRDRNPTQNPSLDGRQESDQEEVMIDAGGAENEESGYVMDIYIRLPAEMFEHQEQSNVGLLVLDSQPDIDEFYKDESDSDSDLFDEEEDENAENHPSTDYPDEEVESDDEYVRNPYMYRNRNASDNEDFDEDDVTYSSDEAKPPWARRPWMNNYSQHDVADDDGDED